MSLLFQRGVCTEIGERNRVLSVRTGSSEAIVEAVETTRSAVSRLRIISNIWNAS